MKNIINGIFLIVLTLVSISIFSSYSNVFQVQASNNNHHPTPTPTRRPSSTPTPTRRPSPTPTSNHHDDNDCDDRNHRGDHHNDDCQHQSTPTVTRTPTLTTTPTNIPTSTMQPTPTDAVITPSFQPTPTDVVITPSFQPTPTNNSEISSTPTPTQTQTDNQTPNNPQQNHDAPVCNDSDPGVPGNLRAAALGGGKVRLDWDNAPGNHTSYAVAYGPSIGNYIYGDPNVGNVTTYTVKALNPGGKYCFYVQAQNGCRGGSPSNVVCSNQGAGTLQILGASDNYNPLVEGIRESYGGEILGASTQLADTAEIVYSADKLPSGNKLDSNQTLIIPKINLSQSIYLPQKVGDQLVVGHNEVLRDGNLYYGHNGYGVFSSLYQLELGDKIVTLKNGVEHQYQISQKLFVDKSEVDAIKTSDNEIALMTCSVTFPNSRIIVKASLLN